MHIFSGSPCKVRNNFPVSLLWKSHNYLEILRMPGMWWGVSRPFDGYSSHGVLLCGSSSCKTGVYSMVMYIYVQIKYHQISKQFLSRLWLRISVILCPIMMITMAVAIKSCDLCTVAEVSQLSCSYLLMTVQQYNHYLVNCCGFMSKS